MNALASKIGVNTHIDFAYAGSPYLDLAKTIRCIKYLKINHLRDAIAKPDTVGKWEQVAMETGVKFCAFLPSESPADIMRSFTYLPEANERKLIEFIEAPNEPDKPYCLERGNSIQWACDFTRNTLVPYARSIKKPLINVSVGGGWEAKDGWQGNYDALPDMTGMVDYANAHTYPNKGRDVQAEVLRLNALAAKSVRNAPVLITELGWGLDERNGAHDPAQIAKDIEDVMTCGHSPYVYLYALFDDQSGRFGLFDDDGTPRPAAKAVRALMGGRV